MAQEQRSAREDSACTQGVGRANPASTLATGEPHLREGNALQAQIAQVYRDASESRPIRASTAAFTERCCLYVGNLPFATTTAELRQFFFGYDIESVTHASAPQNRPGFAFVTLKTHRDVERAIFQLHREPFAGRTISVEMARQPSRPRLPSILEY